MKKQNFDFLKKPEFWITTCIAIILTFAGGFFAGKAYVYYYGDYHDIRNNTNCLINSPNSVQSNYQQSGITAQTVNINAETDRDLDEKSIAEIEKSIKGIKKYLPSQNNDTLINMGYVANDGETQRYYWKLRNYLVAAGHNVNPDLAIVYDRPFSGLKIYNDSKEIYILVGNKP